MKSALLAVASVSTAVIVASCSGGGGGGGAGPRAGTSTGTLQVLATVTCVAGTGALADATATWYVTTEDDTGNSIAANVVVAPHGGTPMTLGSSGIGTYFGTFAGGASAFDLDITSSSGTLTGVVLALPNDFVVSVSPNPPVAGAGATVKWTPSGGSQGALVEIFSLTSPGLPTYQDQGPVADNGAESVPGSAFPTAGTYRVDVGRASLQTLAGSGNRAVPILDRATNVTVP